MNANATAADIATYRDQATRYAKIIRENYGTDRDPVLSGTFDRFIGAIAHVMALEIHAEFGSDERVTIDAMHYWHSEPRKDSRRARRAISVSNFRAVCSAFGIPQMLIVDNDVSGADYFDKVYSKVLFEALGWQATP